MPQRRQYLPRHQYLPRQQVLRRQLVPTGFPLAIPERRTTCIPRKGGYPQTRGGLSLLPRIFHRHQHLSPGCQLWSPECSTRFSQSLYDLVGLFRTPFRTLLHYNGSFSSRPNPLQVFFKNARPTPDSSCHHRRPPPVKVAITHGDSRDSLSNPEPSCLRTVFNML